jgi:hypothetical protein
MQGVRGLSDIRKEMSMRLSCRFAILLVVSGAGALLAAAQRAPPRALPHADPAQGVVIPDEYGSMVTAGTSLDPLIDAEGALTHPS